MKHRLYTNVTYRWSIVSKHAAQNKLKSLEFCIPWSRGLFRSPAVPWYSTCRCPYLRVVEYLVRTSGEAILQNHETRGGESWRSVRNPELRCGLFLEGYEGVLVHILRLNILRWQPYKLKIENEKIEEIADFVEARVFASCVSRFDRAHYIRAFFFMTLHARKVWIKYLYQVCY